MLAAPRDLKRQLAHEGETLVFDTLTARDEDGSAIPRVVSWETNADVTEYTLRVQESVYFTDGTLLTAEHIQYSLEYFGPFRSVAFLNLLEDITIVDELTLHVRFSETFGLFPMDMNLLFAVPLGSVDETGTITDWTGTGQFIIEEYEVDQQAVLVTNMDYWDRDRVPDIDGVTIMVIPDVNARIMALRSGTVHALGVSECLNTYPMAAVAEIQNLGDFNVRENNAAANVQAYGFNYLQGPLTDINLRRAIVYAIDRDTIADALLYGIGVGRGHFTSPGIQFFAENETEYTFDLERARAALAEGGYTETNADGIILVDGEPLVLRIVIRTGATPDSVALIVQDMLRYIGIDSEITSLPIPEANELVRAGDYDISWTHPFTSDPQRHLLSRPFRGEYDDSGLGYDISDDFVANRHTALSSTDPNEIQEAFNRIWADIYAFYLGTGLHTSPRVFMYSQNVSGFVFDPDVYYINLTNVVIN